MLCVPRCFIVFQSVTFVVVLRLLCRNPDGLFWAGDTAQTISAGSSFRFDDLKAFLYRIEVWPYILSSATETHFITLVSQQDQSKHLIQDRSVTDPTATFQLTVNYRSRGGIVNCAHTVIERITRFWPNAIDALQAEEGIPGDSKPKFFRGWDQDTVRYEQFLFGTSCVGVIFLLFISDHSLKGRPVLNLGPTNVRMIRCQSFTVIA